MSDNRRKKGRAGIVTVAFGVSAMACAPWSAAASTVEILHKFVEVRGVADRLIQDSDGKLYGTTEFGGALGAGTVFRLNPDGTAFEVLHSFSCESGDGCSPVAGLTAGSDGKLYGTARSGGARFGGTIFRLNPDGTGFEVVHSFSCDAGCGPAARLTAGSDGKFYGTTEGGGASFGGTVFRLNPNSTDFVVLHSFDCGSDGCLPVAGLTAGSDGKFYGTTSRGGASPGDGTVFRLSPDGTNFEVLHDFDCSRGCLPLSGLTAGRDGKLYGTTRDGGDIGVGAVFRLSSDSTTLELIHSFSCGTSGCDPSADLTEGSDGKLYGTTRSGGPAGGGTIFRLNANGTAVEQILHSFTCESSVGCDPRAALTVGSDGKLYGTTDAGGAAGGAVFAIETNGSISMVHPLGCFICAPFAGLTAGSDGKLYGTTTRGGGAADGGTIFRLNPDGTMFAVLHSFTCASDDGCQPFAGLTQGSDGKLYGTTRNGGASFVGTVFRLNPDGTEFELLHEFNCATGCFPMAGLTAGSDGKLYGTTQEGGTAFEGTAFRLNPDGTDFELLHEFNCASGCLPRAGLTQGSDGKLYGTTESGGASFGGMVFRLNPDPDDTDFKVLHEFTCESDDGCGPSGGLIQGSDGKLYGTTGGGGASFEGTVFRLNPDPDDTDFKVLYSFACETGCGPSGGLTVGSDGKFYGTTAFGGTSFGGGTVFRLNPDGTAFEVVHAFTCENGCGPLAGLTVGSDGKFYGTTGSGGDGGGTVFRLTITPPAFVGDFFLRGSGTANPPTLFLGSVAPVATTAKYKDSASVNFNGGNAWKLVGTWSAPAALSAGQLASLSDLHAWLGLKNSDDQGTRFDLRAEVYKNGQLVASGLTRCIVGITRNENQAKEVTVSFAPFAPAEFNGTTDVLKLTLNTRIGTNSNGTKCGGHNNAVGLRLYFDAVNRASRFGAEAP